MSAKKNLIPAPDDRPDRELFQDPGLVEFQNRMPEARKVSIQRMSDTGALIHKGSFSIETFSLDSVQQRFGGGTYQFLLHDGEGKLLKRITNIEIDDLPEAERRAQVAAPIPAAAAPVSEFALMREQMAADRMLLLEIVRGMSKQQQPAAPPTDITQLVSALVKLKELEPKRETQPAVQDLLLKSFTSGIEVAAKLSKGTATGEASPLGEILGFVREVFQDARPIIQAALTGTAAPASIANPPAVPIAAPIAAAAGEGEEMDPNEIDLTPALAFVRSQLENGIPPKALGEIVLAQMARDESLNETLSSLIADEPIERFLDLAPEFKTEPLRSKFGEFFGVVRARISQDRDTGGTGRDTPHPNGNAGIDTQSR
jgi:hypothetical protein